MNEPPVYTARFEKRARKSLDHLPPEICSHILQKIYQLERDPRLSGSIKLSTGEGEFYRVRVGDYRIIYQIINDQLIVLIAAVDHRKDVYRDF
jgi:mRNA interferase RelE/StbE